MLLKKLLLVALIMYCVTSIMPLSGLNLFDNSVFGFDVALDEFTSNSRLSFPLDARDFILKYQSNPTLGIVDAGRAVAISMTVQDMARTEPNGTIFYITQVLDMNSFAIDIQFRNVSLAGSGLIEVSNYWTPKEAGTYKINGFLWITEYVEGEGFMTPLTNKTSLSIDVKPSAEELKTYTVCKSGCDYFWLQTAIDRQHKSGEKILIKDGDYELRKPINLWSGTKLEFADKARIEFVGGSGLAVFQAKNVQNIEVINPQISVIKDSGVIAFSFNSSKIINIRGGELSLVHGDNSAGFYCRDCMNVLISNVSMTSASRLVDIGTNSQISDGKSSDIWITYGKYDSSSMEAIKVNYSNNVNIIGNNITTSYDNGINIGHNYHTLVRDNYINNGGVPFGSAIHTDSTISADILENFINGTTNDGIRVYRASNINVFNNTIINSYNGIAIVTADEPSSGIKINGNQIMNTLHGIIVSANQQNVGIFDNRLERVENDLAIRVDSSNNSTIVDGNIVFQ